MAELSSVVLGQPVQTQKPFVGYVLAFDGSGQSTAVDLAQLDKVAVGLGNVLNLKVQPAAARDPLATDDASAGFAVLSRWTHGAREWVCTDAAIGAAVWTETTGGGGVAGPVDGNTTSFFFRRKSAAAWVTDNDVLGEGEVGFENDTGYAKIGNGVTGWNARPYLCQVPLTAAMAALLSGATSSTTANTLGLRDGFGRMRVTAPRVTADVATLGTAYLAAADFASSTEPENPAALMRWHDVGASALKVRNATNEAWTIVRVYGQADDPSADDDVNAGFVQGADWLTTTGKIFQLLDPAAGAAVWAEFGAAVPVTFADITGAIAGNETLNAALGAKEDAIGTKKTAFNVDFGTTSGTALAGTHAGSTDEHPVANLTTNGLMPTADRQALNAATASSTASTLAKRDSAGNIGVGTAVNSGDAINKGDAATLASTAQTDAVSAAASATATAISTHAALAGAHGTDNILNNSTVVGTTLTTALNNVMSLANAAGAVQQDPVIDVLNAPAVSPATGARYLVGTAGTGAFSGHNNEIAVWGGSSYTFTAPSQGWRTIATNYGGLAGSNVPLTFGTTTWTASPAGSDTIRNNSTTVAGTTITAAMDSLYVLAGTGGGGQQDPVIDVLNTPVASAVVGARYLVGPSPASGSAFAGHANDIATATSATAYTFVDAVQGWRTVVTNLNGVTNANVPYVFGATTWSRAAATVFASDVVETTDYKVLTAAERTNLLTTDQKNAAAGTGTPSSSNKFVTADTLTAHAGDARAHAPQPTQGERRGSAGVTTAVKSSSPADILDMILYHAPPAPADYATSATTALAAPTQPVYVLRAPGGDIVLPPITDAARELTFINRTGIDINITPSVAPIQDAQGFLARENSISPATAPTVLPTTAMSLSCWLYIDRTLGVTSGAGTSQSIFTTYTNSTSPWVNIGFMFNNQFGIAVFNAAQAVVLNLQIPYTALSTNAWHHVDIGFDIAAGTRYIIVDGVAVTLATSTMPATSTVMNWGSADAVAVGGRKTEAANFGWRGGIAQFWMADTYVDRTISTNALKSYAAGQTDFGPNGLNAGASPCIFLNTRYNPDGVYPNEAPGAVDSWANNPTLTSNVADLVSLVPAGTRADKINSTTTYLLAADRDISLYVEKLGNAPIPNWVVVPLGGPAPTGGGADKELRYTLDITANAADYLFAYAPTGGGTIASIWARTVGGTCSVQFKRQAVASATLLDPLDMTLVSRATGGTAAFAVNRDSAAAPLAASQTVISGGRIWVTVTNANALSGLLISVVYA